MNGGTIMQRDMTVGKPIKLIMALSIPLFIGNIFEQFYNMADSIVVGRAIGKDALAAVGSTGSALFVVIGFAIGIASGFSICIAQQFGAEDYKTMRKYVANSFYLAAAVAVIMTAVTVIFARPILELMRTPADIIDDAYSYIVICFAGISATVLYNLMAAMLRALGDAKTPLVFLIIAVILNVILDILFVVVFKWGCPGVGYATVIAQALAGILCLIYTKRAFPILKLSKDELAFDPKICLKLLSIGVPMALQFSVTGIGIIIMQMAVNGFGTDTVAAVTAASKVQSLVTMPMDSIGITMATFCGQNLGAKKIKRIEEGVRSTLILEVVYSVGACLLMYFLGATFAKIFLDGEQPVVIARVTEYFHAVVMFYPALGILFVLRNSLQGLGFSFMPMLAGASELIARGITVFAFTAAYGYTAVCLADPIAWIAAAVFLIFTYLVLMPKLKHRVNRQLAESNEN